MTTNRRTVIKGLAAGGLNLLLPGGLYAKNGPRRISPNEKIRVASIGVGGRGRAALEGVSGEQFVAFCDVDDKRAAWAYERWNKVPHFRDFREMFDKVGDQIDAVTVSSPDHVHFAHAMEAIKHGKHVYVEKPLCHTIAQTRELQAAAKSAGLKTQMGNQGHSQDSIRSLKEWNQAGIIGPVMAVDAWTDRPAGWWPQGQSAWPPAQPIPASLDWKLWCHGVEAPFSKQIAPFNWRGWTPFGTGALGDMACHIFDPFYFAFEPGSPDWIMADAEGGSDISFPETAVVRYHFPAKAKRPEFLLTFWSGKGIRPSAPRVLERGQQYPESGSVVYGSRETVLIRSHAQKIQIIPSIRAAELQPDLPAATLTRIKGQNHFANWLDAIRGNVDQASSHFDYSSKLNELVLLGVIAQRLPGKRLKYDAASGKFTNSKEANHFINSALV